MRAATATEGLLLPLRGCWLLRVSEGLADTELAVGAQGHPLLLLLLRGCCCRAVAQWGGV